MNFKVKGANFVAVVFFGLVTFWLGDTMANGTPESFEGLFVPAFFSFLAFVGFLVGLFACGNKSSK